MCNNKFAGLDLFKAMRKSGRYANNDAIVEAILDMRDRVLIGERPEDVLSEVGFKHDYIFDIFVN